MSANAHLRYSDYQAAGRLVQRWIEEPTAEGCTIPLSQVDLEDLKGFQQIEVGAIFPPWLPLQIEDHFDELNTFKPESGGWSRLAIEDMYKMDTRVNVWVGQLAPRILMVEEIKRGDGPYSFEIALAFYKSHCPIENLDDVYMLDVRNEETLGFVGIASTLKPTVYSGRMRSSVIVIAEPLNLKDF